MSGLCYLVIAAAIYFNKELQVHPMKLIMYTLFSNAFFFFNQFNLEEICNFKLP